jgi:hypothetical protein
MRSEAKDETGASAADADPPSPQPLALVTLLSAATQPSFSNVGEILRVLSETVVQQQETIQELRQQDERRSGLWAQLEADYGVERSVESGDDVRRAGTARA